MTLELAMTVPAAPALLTPGAGVSGVSLLPTFTWAAAAEAATYDLEVATDVALRQHRGFRDRSHHDQPYPDDAAPGIDAPTSGA